MYRRALVAALAILASASIVAADTPAICDVHGSYGAGARSASVQTLQEFLEWAGTFSDTPTGYFGPLTASALARYQLQSGIVSSLSAGGTFGPKTYAFIQQKWCGGSQNISSAIVPVSYARTSHTCGKIDPPACAGGTLSQEYDAYGCLARWQCTTSSHIQAPSISTFGGPTTLDVGAVGMWTVQATDPQNQPLSYTMLWGDESTGTVPQPVTLPFTHAYAAAGTYTLSLTAANTGGASVRTSRTIFVGTTTTTTITTGLGTTPSLLSATPTSGVIPFPVLFSAEGTRDTYIDGFGTTAYATSTHYIDFGDSTPVQRLSCAFGIGQTCTTTVTHTYRASGPASFTAILYRISYSTAGGIRTDLAQQTITVQGATVSGTSIGSCAAPWGGAVAQNGATLPHEPFFTNGVMTYSDSTRVKCVNGTWTQCNVAGVSCPGY